jgi:hypothetical protein
MRNYLHKNENTGRHKTATDSARNPGRRVSFQQKALQPIDTHYLDKSFEFYPCTCQFNRKLTVQLALRCHDCLMSMQSRITHMKTKI